MQYIEPNWIKVEKIKIKNTSFPESLSTFKLIQISDLHIKSYGIRERQMVRILNTIKPNIILITGDLISEKKHLSKALFTLAQLKPKNGVFVVMGDNDKDAFGSNNIKEFKTALLDIGIKVLDDESLRIPLNKKDGLWIIGITNPQPDNELIKAAYAGVNLNEPIIIFTHYPEVADSEFINKKNSNLILAGGSHGGQIGIPFILKFFDKASEFKYVSGLYNVRGMPLYVNRGIGTSGDGPMDTFRLFCRPEITLITLEKKK
jgi:predicted MPP superfamily phosphohydrolase